MMNVTWKDVAMGVLTICTLVLTSYVASFANQMEKQNEAIVNLRISVEVLKTNNDIMRRDFKTLSEVLERR